MYRHIHDGDVDLPSIPYIQHMADLLTYQTYHNIYEMDFLYF